MLSDWRSGSALASHCCNLGTIPGFGMCDGFLVTKSGSWVYGFPPTKTPYYGHMKSHDKKFGLSSSSSRTMSVK